MTRIRLALATLSASLVLATCGGAPTTPDALIVGEWEQSAPVSVGEGQMAMTMSSSEMEYDADGTMEGEVMITIPAMGETADEYRMTAEGRYRVEGTTLIETVENVTVEALDGGDEAAQVARMVQAAMLSQAESRSEIVSIDRKRLVTRAEGTGLELAFDRD